jgi:post-segregation antitoxin (ccd killing protein)
MRKQVRINLSMDKEEVEKAKEMGINLSKYCENALKEAIQKLQSSNSIAKCENTDFSLSEGSLFPEKRKFEWTGRDLNPRPPDCESGVHTKLNYQPSSTFD